MPKLIEAQLIKEFKDCDSFTRDELFNYYKYFEPNLVEGTLSWRIYDLKKRGIIKVIKRGVYTIAYKPPYRPHVSEQFVRISKHINSEYGDLKNCIWESRWLNEFALHQSNKNIVIVEIDKDLIDTVYYNLKEFSKHEVFINPDLKTFQYYISESINPVVVKPFISRSPIRRLIKSETNVFIPKLEKILVDIIADSDLFTVYQGSDLISIFESIITEYSINFTSLLSYASRRRKDEQIKLFLSDNLPNLVKTMLDD